MNNGILTTDEMLKLVKARRKELKLSLTQFAGKLKVSQQFLSRVLAGTAYPGPKIAKSLGYEQTIVFQPSKAGFKHNGAPVGGHAKARKAAKPRDISPKRKQLLVHLANGRKIEEMRAAREKKATAGK